MAESLDNLGAHWDNAYGAGDTGVSWFQDSATVSRRLIASVAEASASVVDIGGGSSPLVDGLIANGHSDIAVLDISAGGLDLAKERLGEAAANVEWIVSGVDTWAPGHTFDVWHDRAVLHFLVEEEDRAAYVNVLKATVPAGGHAVIGVFAEDGPEACSGLEVRRYSAAELADLLGDAFEIVANEREMHMTPGGNEQSFNWVVARRL